MTTVFSWFGAVLSMVFFSNVASADLQESNEPVWFLGATTAGSPDSNSRGIEGGYRVYLKADGSGILRNGVDYALWSGLEVKSVDYEEGNDGEEAVTLKLGAQLEYAPNFFAGLVAKIELDDHEEPEGDKSQPIVLGTYIAKSFGKIGDGVWEVKMGADFLGQREDDDGVSAFFGVNKAFPAK